MNPLGMQLAAADTRLFGVTVGQHKSHVDLSSFSSEFFDHETLPSANLQGLREYSQTAGTLRLRTAIANFLKVNAENVLITDGASQALHITLSLYASKSSPMLIPRPWFPSFYWIPSLYSSNIDTYDPASLDSLSTALERQPALAIINYPNNPTGVSLQFDGVSGRAPQTTTMVFDNAYSWLLDAPLTCGRGIYIYSVGKLLGLPGLRIGALISNDSAIISAAVALKRQFSLHSCPIAEDVAFQCLTSWDLDHYHKKWRTKIRSRIKELHKKNPRLLADPERTVGPFISLKQTEKLKRHIAGVHGDAFGNSANITRICVGAKQEYWDYFVEIICETL